LKPFPRGRSRRHAERPVAPRVDRSVLLTVPSPSPPPLPLQLALPVCKPSPINSVGDRIPNCLRSFALNAGLGNNPTTNSRLLRALLSEHGRVNRLQRARERERGGPRAPPRGSTADTRSARFREG